MERNKCRVFGPLKSKDGSILIDSTSKAEFLQNIYASMSSTDYMDINQLLPLRLLILQAPAMLSFFI